MVGWKAEQMVLQTVAMKDIVMVALMVVHSDWQRADRWAGLMDCLMAGPKVEWKVVMMAA